MGVSMSLLSVLSCAVVYSDEVVLQIWGGGREGFTVSGSFNTNIYWWGRGGVTFKRIYRWGKVAKILQP